MKAAIEAAPYVHPKLSAAAMIAAGSDFASRLTRRESLCRAPFFLHFDLIAGRTGDDKQARKPPNSWDCADQFHHVAATQATQNGQIVS
jgi:hypothetical protein